MNPITMQLIADKYIRLALEEDISSEDVSTNAVMPEYKRVRYSLSARRTASLPDCRFLSVYLRFWTLKPRWSLMSGTGRK